MNKYIIVSLISFSAFLLFQPDAAALTLPILGESSLEVQMNINLASLSLRESGDEIYTGKITNTGLGIGVHAFALKPLGDGRSWGPNFNFTYEQINNNEWYSFETYHFAVGPALKYYWNGHPFYTFINYDLGFIVAEQEIGVSTDLNPRPAGKFVANMYGIVAGWRGQMADINETFTIGPYLTYTLQTLLAFKYQSRTPTYTNQFVDINTSFLQAGISISYK